MKKTTLALCGILFSASILLTSCSTDLLKNSDASLVESYKADAREYIDDGDFESAIKTLEKGIEKTGDKSLSDMVYAASDVYAMTNYEAQNECGESFGTGTAVIKEKVYNGQNTYELISYRIY